MRTRHLYRYKKNGLLYKIYQNFGRYLGPTYSAEPYKHNDHVGDSRGHVKLEQFTKVSEI